MDLRETILMIPGILIGFTLHEYAHAQVAVWLGDDTPKYQGRLSLSPFTHIDIIGFICILIAGYGWAKPVQVNELNFRNPRRDDITVSIAGPLMNLFVAFSFLVIMKITYYIPPSIVPDTLYTVIMDIFNHIVWINVALFVFNLLPLPPLDGFNVFSGLVGLKSKEIYSKIYSYARIVFPILIISNLLDKIIDPATTFIFNNLSMLFFK